MDLFYVFSFLVVRYFTTISADGSHVSSVLDDGRPILRAALNGSEALSKDAFWVGNLKSGIKELIDLHGIEQAKPYIDELVKDAEKEHHVKIRIKVKKNEVKTGDDATRRLFDPTTSFEHGRDNNLPQKLSPQNQVDIEHLRDRIFRLVKALGYDKAKPYIQNAIDETEELMNAELYATVKRDGRSSIHVNGVRSKQPPNFEKLENVVEGLTQDGVMVKKINGINFKAMDFEVLGDLADQQRTQRGRILYTRRAGKNELASLENAMFRSKHGSEWKKEFKTYVESLVATHGRKKVLTRLEPVIKSLEKRHHVDIRDIDVDKEGKVFINYKHSKRDSKKMKHDDEENEARREDEKRSKRSKDEVKLSGEEHSKDNIKVKKRTKKGVYVKKRSKEGVNAKNKTKHDDVDGKASPDTPKKKHNDKTEVKKSSKRNKKKKSKNTLDTISKDDTEKLFKKPETNQMEKSKHSLENVESPLKSSIKTKAKKLENEMENSENSLENLESSLKSSIKTKDKKPENEMKISENSSENLEIPLKSSTKPKAKKLDSKMTNSENSFENLESPKSSIEQKAKKPENGLKNSENSLQTLKSPLRNSIKSEEIDPEDGEGRYIYVDMKDSDEQSDELKKYDEKDRRRWLYEPKVDTPMSDTKQKVVSLLLADRIQKKYGRRLFSSALDYDNHYESKHSSWKDTPAKNKRRYYLIVI